MKTRDELSALLEAEALIYVLLPAYNEAGVIGNLLQRIEDTNYVDYVIVVDDGSNDETGSVVERWPGNIPRTVLRHERNKGLGVAMQTGIRWAAESLSPNDVLVVMDADDTHNPALIPEMTAQLGEDVDVVIASRFPKGAGEIGVPLHRRFLSHGASCFMRFARPIPNVRDYTCGYRAYRVGALSRIVSRYGIEGIVTTPGFSCMAEILLRLAAQGARFAEVPLVLRYDRKGGESKMRVARTLTQYVSVLHAVPRRDVVGGASRA